LYGDEITEPSANFVTPSKLGNFFVPSNNFVTLMTFQQLKLIRPNVGKGIAKFMLSDKIKLQNFCQSGRHKGELNFITIHMTV
jgi:hypothetical protein